MKKTGKEVIAEAYDRLERVAPRLISRMLHWVRKPNRWWLRIAIGLVCIVGACVWFLPVVGIELFPVGVLFLAQDVPFMRRPVGIGILWCLDKWQQLRDRWGKRHGEARG